MQETCQWPGNLTHLFEGFLYLHQGVPVCNGFPWIRQHLVPVVPAEAFSIDPHSTDSYDLIVTNSERETKVLVVLVIQNAIRTKVQSFGVGAGSV